MPPLFFGRAPRRRREASMLRYVYSPPTRTPARHLGIDRDLGTVDVESPTFSGEEKPALLWHPGDQVGNVAMEK
jgi:hypothetical protein